tara:strand:+ start:4278 stop:4544 length:267 start_codon:yes stop_codon:yes gene_type:complete
VKVAIRLAAPEIQFLKQNVLLERTLSLSLAATGPSQPGGHGRIMVCERVQFDPLGKGHLAAGGQASQDCLQAETGLCGQHRPLPLHTC